MSDLHPEIRTTISLSDANRVAPLFMKLFSHQLHNNAPLSAYYRSLSITSTNISCWKDIPPVPTDVFKLTPNPTCLPQDSIQATFLTSGTTGETRGAHHFSSTLTYETSILAGWKHCQLPDLHRTFILTPSPAEAPHSSLSHMMETLRQHHCPTAEYIMLKDSLDVEKLITASQTGEPITLLGTALAFLHLFEELETPIVLPSGSWAMETGGYKGSGRTLSKEDLYALFKEKLHLEENDIWNEYSMTELSSQFYTRGIGQPHMAPPWVKIRVIHPETGKDVEEGDIGYLAIYDLANVDSALAIRTQDLAIYHDEHSFTLIGRDPSALPRGCSRSADEALS